MVASLTLRHDKQYVLGMVLITISAISFGMITTCAKFAFEGGANPMTLVCMRIVAALLVIAPLQWVRGNSLVLPFRVLKGTAWMSISLLMMSVGYLSGVAYIDVSLAVILLYTFPLMVGVLAPLVGREKMTVAKAAFLVGTFIGLTIALAPSLGGTADWRGIAWVLLAATGVTFSLTFGAGTIGSADPQTVNIWANAWMLIAAGLLTALGPGFAFPRDVTGWTGALGVAGFYVLAFTCLFAALPKLRPAQVALILNLEPIVSTMSAVFILGEAVGLQTWGGILVMVFFLTTATIFGRRHSA